MEVFGNAEGCLRAQTGDGHWWPETYYLGSFQARRALSSVRVYVSICPTGHAGAMLNAVINPFRCCKMLSKQMNLQRKRLQGSPKTFYFIRRIGFTASSWSRSGPFLAADTLHTGLVQFGRQ
jgi:hypothetical protein